MEAMIIKLGGLLFKMLVRWWAKDDKVLSQNIIDIEQFAGQCGLSIWEAKRFNRSIEEFVDLIAEDFIKEFGQEIQEEERKEEIIRQIQEDVEKLNICDRKLILAMSNSEDLCNAIMDQSKSKRALWDDKEIGVYKNCVRYISKAGIDFVSKLPSFTPEALKVIIQRQEEYHKEFCDVLEDIHSLTKTLKGVDATYREYEGIYREKIIEKYSKVEIIGAGIKDRNIKRYDISSAYVELNCIDDDEFDEEIGLSQVFISSNIVWIKGEAGSGKTTFLQWVAVCAAKNEYQKIENIRNTIPIIIGLRNIEWPINLHEIVNRITSPFGNNCPEGWISELLKKNRAILLFDGLDEISQVRRDKTYDFIEDIVKQNPKIKVLLTARNSVHDELDCNSTSYEIMPMKTGNIKEFIRYWHRSVLRQDALADDEEIKKLQENLFLKIIESQALKTLARNPLLCAMICALNFVNEEQLPNDKMELYDKCCEMLVDARDSQRKIDNNIYKDLPKLDYSRKRKVLEELAFWMMNGGVSSESKGTVLAFFEHLFKDTNIFDKKSEYNAETLLNYFVERSGIIREPEKDIIDFVHKTFMEFLAVKAICRNCAWNILIKEACNVNWKETIIMCFREMGKNNVEEVLYKLIENGENKGDSRYILIASLGASNAVFLADNEIKKEIDKQIKSLIPPNNMSLYEIAQAGTYLLPFLKDTYEYSNVEKLQCLALLDYLETEEAIPDIVSYLLGNGSDITKGHALAILCKYEELHLEEYNVKDQLIDILKSSAHGKSLTVHESLLNIICNKELDASDKKYFMQFDSLTLLCDTEEENLYFGEIDFLKYFRNCKKITLIGDIHHLNYLKFFQDITELTIKSPGDLSEPIQELSSYSNLKSIKKLYISAEKLNYFCNNDLSNMTKIETLEIHCCDDALVLDLNFEEFYRFPMLKQVLFEVNTDQREKIEKDSFSWERKTGAYIYCYHDEELDDKYLSDEVLGDEDLGDEYLGDEDLSQFLLYM